MKIKRLLYITDEHHPHIIPAVHNYLHPSQPTPFLNFLKDFDPHYLVQGGDQLDLSVIAHWNKGKPRIKEGKRLIHDYNTYNQILDNREKRMKSLERHVMLEGNHDYWIQQLLDENPEFEGMIEVQKNLSITQRGIEWVDARKHAKIGKLNFIHGDYKDGYLPVFAAKAIANLYNRSMVYGHQHTNQVYSAQAPFDQKPYQVWGVGCMCNLNPAWQRNSPNAWVNSFGVGYIMDNGDFDFQVINIIKNTFVFEGQLYK
jgi:hypothetical protein